MGTAHASDPDNLFGGRIVSQRQAYAVVGYPHVEGGVRFPIGAFELTPRFRISYGVGTFSSLPNAAAVDVGVGFRWELVDSGDLSGALVGDLWGGAALGNLPTAGGVGLFSPGWMMTYRVGDVLDVDFGLLFQADLWIQQGVPFFVGAVPIVFGAEFRVVDSVVLGFRFEGGPSFTGGTPPRGASAITASRGVGARLRAVVGVGFSF